MYKHIQSASTGTLAEISTPKPEQNAVTRPPLPTIRAKCLDCRGGSPRAVRECSRVDCSLWEYRLGHRPTKGTAKRTPLQALRAFCSWCCLNQPTEVRLCPAKGCPSWPYRLGKRPMLPSPQPDDTAPKNGCYEADSVTGEPVSGGLS